MSDLPLSWAEATLDHLLAEPLANGRSVPDGDGFPVLRLSALRGGRLDLTESKRGSWTATEAASFSVCRNDLLVVRGNGSIRLVGRAGLVDVDPPAVAYPDTMIRVRPNPSRVRARFLAHQWEAVRIRSQVERAARTTAGIYKVSQGDLRNLRFVVPPLDEQDRIVAAIETHFSRLDAAVASLTRAKANVKRARASVLKAAVEGRLVPTEAEIARAEGREYEPASVLLERILVERKAAWAAGGGRGKYAEPVKPETEGLAGLPEGWCWASVDELTAQVTDGDHQPPPVTADGIPFLVIGNVKSGEPDFSSCRKVPAAYYESLDWKRRPDRDDLLYTVVGSLGIPVRVSDNRPFCVQRHIAILKRPLLGVYDYLRRAMASGFVFRQAEEKATGTAQQTLGLASLRSMVLPLPPLAEQHRITTEVDRRLSVLDALDATLDTNLARCARLRQSILKRAFEGRLVPAEATTP